MDQNIVNIAGAGQIGDRPCSKSGDTWLLPHACAPTFTPTSAPTSAPTPAPTNTVCSFTDIILIELLRKAMIDM